MRLETGKRKHGERERERERERESEEEREGRDNTGKVRGGREGWSLLSLRGPRVKSILSTVLRAAHIISPRPAPPLIPILRGFL